MEFVEAFRMAWTALRTNRLRSGLTLLGMVIGVFAIISSVTAVKVIDVYFRDSMNFLGSSTFTISRYPSIRVSNERFGHRRPITYAQIERLKRSLSQPVFISILEHFDLGAVRYQGRETEPNVQLIGTDENFLENFSYELGAGRFITAQDVHYARPVIVLGSVIAEELFPNETPLGKVVRFGGHRYEVIGVLKTKGSFLGFSQDRRALIPITTAFARYGLPERDLASVSVRVSSPERLGAAMDEVISKLRIIRKVAPGQPNDFEISTNDSMRSIFEAFTRTLSMGGAGIGLIALLAAGIGIMNIMLVSVTERTREIGIRKAVGARRRDILRQFLLEAFFLCQIGGIVGILLGALAGNLVAVYFDISAVFPWSWALGGMLLVTLVAVVFGSYPAYKAARLNPIDALRYE